MSTLSSEELQTADTRWFITKCSWQFICWWATPLCHVCRYMQRRGTVTHQHWAILIQSYYWQGLQDTFPRIAIALRMYLLVMVTNCSAERSFSKLKLFENRLRTFMTREQLVNLKVVSIESYILYDTDFTVIFNDCAIAKSRDVSCLWRVMSLTCHVFDVSCLWLQTLRICVWSFNLV